MLSDIDIEDLKDYAKVRHISIDMHRSEHLDCVIAWIDDETVVAFSTLLEGKAYLCGYEDGRRLMRQKVMDNIFNTDRCKFGE